MARAAARSSIHGVFAAFLILLVLASPALAQDTRVDEWRADLATLVERFEARHPDPYHTIPREVFRESVDGLHARISDLENHEIVVELARTSFRYQISSYPGDDRAALFPHVAAPPTIRSYRMNRDPALHAALEWRPRQPIAQRIAEAATADGFEGAWTAWTTWRDDPANRWLDAEGDLNTAGYRLLREEKTEAAAALFRVNAEAHPESANVHDSLAEGLVALGDTAAAFAAYERSLALDPTGPLGANALRMIRELRGRP